MNGLVDAVNRLTAGVNAPSQPRVYGRSGGSPVIRCTIVSHEDDYLECVETGTSNTVYVAKPYELQRTPFDGETVEGVNYSYGSGFAASQERTATSNANPSEVEQQFITPAYVVGAEIMAVRVQGNTGVSLGGSPEEFVLYTELNQGRAFAYDPDA